MNLKTLTTATLAIAAMAASPGAARADTWYWTGIDTTAANSPASSWGYDANKAANWTNLVTQSQGIPQAGDIIAYSSDYVVNTTYGIGIRNIAGTTFGGVLFEKGSRPICQSTLKIADGGSVTFTDAAASSTWTCNLDFAGTGTVSIASGKTLTLEWRRVSGANATLVKEGAGSFILKNNDNFNSGTESNIGTILLRGGTLGSHWAKGVKEFRFDSNDPSIRLQIGTRNLAGGDGFIIENGILSEAECVNNTAHGVTSSYGLNITFTGTPKIEDMAFTGTFYGSAGLVWNPSSADYTFSFKKATHQTTGVIAVSNGTVRACDGARFPNLSRVDVDGANSLFRVDTTGGFPMPSATVALSNGGKLSLVSGVRVSVSSVTVDGVAVAPGLYHGAGAASTLGSMAAAWIDGAGLVTVGVSAATQTSATWTGAGADPMSDTAANWSGSAPTLTDGSAFVTATGGTGFTAAGDVWLNGFDLTAVSPFALSATSGKEIWLGSGGIRGGNGSYSIDAPVAATAAQTWNFREGATVDFNTPFASGTDAAEIWANGTGAVFNVNSSLGPQNFRANLEYKAKLNIAAGVTNNADIRQYNDVAGSPFGSFSLGEVVFKGGAPIVINGFVDNTNTEWRLKFEANADVTFNGGFLSRNGTYISGIGANARVRFNKPFLGRSSFAPNNFDSTAVIELNAEGNCLGQGNPWLADGYGPFKGGTIRTLVPYALKDFNVPAGTFEYKGTPLGEVAAGRFHMANSAVLDLYGNDQSLQILYAAGGTVTSTEDAVMTLNDSSTWTSATANKTRVDYATWEGGAGLVFNGVSADWPRYMMKVSSTTGRLEVVQGRLVFPSASGDALVTSIGAEAATSVARPAANAGWPNCSSVTIRGGTLEIEHSNALGKQTVVNFVGGEGGAYGKIKLAAGVRQRVDSLWVDGVKLPAGTYGAAGSGATFVRSDLFAAGGTGILNVPGSATVVVFK